MFGFHKTSKFWTKPCHIDNILWERTDSLASKGKEIPLQAWTGPKVSRSLRALPFQISSQSAHEGGKVASPKQRRLLLPQEIFQVLISVTG
jgi:hypothetical protein